MMVRFKNIFLIVIYNFYFIGYSQPDYFDINSNYVPARRSHLPTEKGDTGRMNDYLTGKNHPFSVAWNDPYAISKKGVDFKPEWFFSKYTGACVGTYFFNRMDNYRELRYGAACIFGWFSDSLAGKNLYVENSNNVMYMVESYFTRFTREKMRYEEIGFSPGWEVLHSNETKGCSGNRIYQKRILQKGFITGMQMYFGRFHAKITQFRQTISSTDGNIIRNDFDGKKYIFPYFSQVVSFGYHRRLSSNWGIKFRGYKPDDYCEYITDFYCKALFAPILYNNYLDGNLTVRPRYTSMWQQLGFSVGANMDGTGAYQGSIEIGIMPGFGFYFKGGFPLDEFSLHRSKALMNGAILNKLN